MADDVIVKYGGDTTGAETAAQRVINSINSVKAASTLSIGAMRANSMNLRAQMIDIAQGIPLLFQSPTYGLLNIANQMAQITQITGGSLTQAFGMVASSVGRFALAFGPVLAVVGTVTAAIGFMQGKINDTSKTQVSFGDVAVGTLRAIGDVINTVVGPAFRSIVDFLAPAIEGIRQLLVFIGNAIVATFVGAFNGIKAIWATLPAVLGDVVLTTVNTVIDLLELMINGSIRLINDFTGLMEAVGLKVAKIGDVDIPAVTNPLSGSAGAAGEPLGDAFRDAFQTDWMGMFFNNIKKYSIEEALKPSKEQLKKWAQGVDAIMDGANKKIADLKAQTVALGMGREQAVAYIEAQHMMADAAARGIPLTARLTDRIKEQAKAIAAATVELEYNTAVQDTLRGIAQGITSAFGEWLAGTSSLEMALLKMTLQLAAAVAEALLLNLILSAMGLALPTTGLGAVFAPLFGGGKAEGGPLSPGKWYIAHEGEPIWGGGNGAFAAGLKGEGGPKMDPKEFAREIAHALKPGFNQQSYSSRQIARTIGDVLRRGGR